MQLVDGRGDEPCAAGSQGVSDGDHAAVRVDMGIIVFQTHIAQDRQALGGKRLVQLDDVHLRHVEAGEWQHLAGCRYRDYWGSDSNFLNGGADGECGAVGYAQPLKPASSCHFRYQIGL